MARGDAARARRIVAEMGAEDAVRAVVAAAPPLPPEVVELLRAMGCPGLPPAPQGGTDTEDSTPERRLLHPVAEVAQLLGVSRSTVYDLLREGELDGVRLGARTMIPRDSLDEYVARLPRWAPQ